ncbi:MAG TPA: glycosyltransferase family 2 protein [Myxococcota bacterium]|nr:glycosyltransferase family 2 protein [Myxococcota bacterium]HOA14270.1 glycosyltransferase family 2 protein [Myxococcota bacterium]HOC98854.1 glycosyltransferase family 2 protein [Myxococcota bacterium]HOH77641.1 glycosyltransferase family 2 protein [Myxococcota bacterium]HPV03472.1 glycosyltransferase family 2 protein [Myxococcota bacterium]
MGSERTEVSIVIPVFNEEGLLETAINDLVLKLNELGWEKEIIITENGSTDRTVEIANDLARRYPFLKVLHTGEPNYGKALRKGIETASGVFVMCDEIDICDVNFHKAALEILKGGEFDMVVGSKRHPDARDARPAFRRFATWVVNMMLRVATGFRGTDTHGLKAFVREATLPVVSRCIVEKDMFASELVIRAERLIRVKEIPVTIVEKRPPAINLFKRVPNVLRNIFRLFLIIRLGKKA